MLLRLKVLSALQRRLVPFRRVSSHHNKGGALNLNVGGFDFSLFPDDISKHPGCYFETLMTDESHEKKTVSLSHDGAIFRFVHAFLVTNSLPKSSETGIVSLDESTLRAVANQAKCLKLPQLSDECEHGLKELRSMASADFSDDEWKEEVHVPIAAPDAPAVQALRQLWRPLYLPGTLNKGQFRQSLFKKSTFDAAKVEELIDTANIIRLPTAPVVPHAFEIGAFLLNKKALDEVAKHIQLAPLFPDCFVKLRPRKLEILCEGSPQHLFSTNSGTDADGETVVGTVEVILNSEYTGGELQVMCDGQTTAVKTEPYSWVAVHTDASCSVSPVTSGARVSLIYDVVNNDGVVNRLLVGGCVFDTWVDYELLPGISFKSPQAAKLVHIAKQLSPANTSTNSYSIDGRLCDEEMVQTLVASAVRQQESNIGRELTVRANRIEVHLPGASFTRTTDDHPTSTGYLGSLVAVMNSDFRGGIVHFNYNGEPQFIFKKVFALPANIVHQMEKVENGARVTLVCDIFDKHMVEAQAVAQDPLSLISTAEEGVDDDSGGSDGDSSGSDISDISDSESASESASDSDSGRCDHVCYDTDCDCGYSSYEESSDDDEYASDGCKSDSTTTATILLPLTRTIPTPLVRDAILSSIANALDSHGAVIITLQNVYPSAVSVDFTTWLGGDRALYDILTNNTDTTAATTDATDNAVHTAVAYDVQLVNVTLHSKYDAKNDKYVLSKGTTTATSKDKSTLLLVPTKLTDAHRVPDEQSVYEVSALRVTKRM